MTRRILFLCTGNSARSIIAEYLLRRCAEGRFRDLQRGQLPDGHRESLCLGECKGVYHIDASEARSKSWDEIRGVEFDSYTVCEQRARNHARFGPLNLSLLIGVFQTPR